MVFAKRFAAPCRDWMENAVRSDSVSRYVAHGRRRVAGWFSRIDAEIVSTIMLSQTSRNVKGDALEIGVHHGKTFILLKLCLHDGETAIAVDVFENQELNVGGRSGKGDRDRLEYNLKRFADGTVNTDIITTSSLDLNQSELKARTSGLRFASIDGGHWYEAVLNDLRLAAHCAGGDCVIAIDDFFNPDFPEVSAAYYAWLQDKPDFGPLCVSSGKLYVCRPNAKMQYFDALSKNKYISFYRKKNVKFMQQEILAFTGRYSGVRGLAIQYGSYYAPTLFEKLRRWKKAKKADVRPRFRRLLLSRVGRVDSGQN